MDLSDVKNGVRSASVTAASAFLIATAVTETTKAALIDSHTTIFGPPSMEGLFISTSLASWLFVISYGGFAEARDRSAVGTWAGVTTAAVAIPVLALKFL